MMTPIIVKEIASPKMVLSSVVKKNIKNTKYQSLLISSPVGRINKNALLQTVFSVILCCMNGRNDMRSFFCFPKGTFPVRLVSGKLSFNGKNQDKQ